MMVSPPSLPPVLVTGGAGYVGSHAAVALLDAGATVVVLDGLSTGSIELIPYGAQCGQASHVPHHLIEIATQVLTGHRESLTTFGTDYPTPDGTALRDYVHVADVAQAHLLLLRHSLAALPRHWSYNVGYGQGSSVRDVVCALSEVAGRPIKCRLGGRRRGDPAMLIADSSRIQHELGWRPRHDRLQTIVDDALRWEEARQARDASTHAAVA